METKGEEETLINYMKLKKFSLFFSYYVFLDTERHLADQLFIHHKVKVYFKEEFAKKGSPYRLIYCKIRKKEEQPFIAALGEMDKKTLLLGYTEYEEYCDIFQKISALQEENNRGEIEEISY